MNCKVYGTVAALLLSCGAPLAVAQVLDESRDCVLGPHVVVDVSSAVPGLLELVTVERSDTVQAGQVLARLESRVEEASLALADAWASIESEVRIEETTRALDRRRHDRISQLYASRAVALDDKDKAETEAALAALRLRQAQEKRWIRELDARKAEATVERRTVRSPIDGVVVERYRVAGEYVENQPVVRIAQLDPLMVETILPMTLFGQVDEGMVAEVRAENAPESPHRAVVTVVDRLGDPASGTFGVRLSLANPGSHIPAGLKCRLQFLSNERAPVPSPEVPALAPPEDPPTPEAPVQESTGPAVQTEAPSAPEPVANTIEAAAPSLVAAPPASLPGPARPGDGTVEVRIEEPQCLSIGPLASSEEARRLVQAIERRGTSASLHSERISIDSGYIVVTPRQADLESAKRLAGELGPVGVTHLQVMFRGDFVNRVSLGVYDTEGMAARRLDEVTALGVEAAVLTRTRDHERWWVRTGLHDAAARDSDLVSLTRDLPMQNGACALEGVRSAEVPAGADTDADAAS